MGDPKKPRKKYRRPRMPWRSDVLAAELQLMGTYGLRNKRELWKAQTELSRIRKHARTLLGAPAHMRAKAEASLLTSLVGRGLVGPRATLDDVLGLKVEDLLERRLQTVVERKGLARSVYQARQVVVHGHIQIGDRVIDRPGYGVKTEEEATVRLKEDSPLLKQASGAST